MKTIKESISTYFKDQDGIVAVFIFGSHTTGTARPFSDIDIGIVAENAVIDRIKNRFRQCMIDLSRILRKDVHLVILNLATENLLSQVFNKGQCLIVNDRKKLSEFKMNAYVKIADFGYHKKQMQAGFIEQLMEV